MPRKSDRRTRKTGRVYLSIPLTQGKETIVDADDYDELSRHDWYAARRHTQWYATRNVLTESGTRTVVYMHRQLMNAKHDEEVDHRNRNGLDNRRENLRLATRSQQMLNSIKRRTTNNPYRGVYWNPQRRKWQAQIKRHGKTCYLGLFTSAEDGARAFDAVALSLWGEDARLNFPPKGGANEQG